mmetsp:Transcript_32621/g.58497  ORF Transcript_32621/g.58497 Transcript_32621/m.58497 type:complete len:218 (-) Transcript_32621:1069-1722(-)
MDNCLTAGGGDPSSELRAVFNPGERRLGPCPEVEVSCCIPLIRPNCSVICCACCFDRSCRCCSSLSFSWRLCSAFNCSFCIFCSSNRNCFILSSISCFTRHIASFNWLLSSCSVRLWALRESICCRCWALICFWFSLSFRTVKTWLSRLATWMALSSSIWVRQVFSRSFSASLSTRRPIISFSRASFAVRNTRSSSCSRLRDWDSEVRASCSCPLCL